MLRSTLITIFAAALSYILIPALYNGLQIFFVVAFSTATGREVTLAMLDSVQSSIALASCVLAGLVFGLLCSRISLLLVVSVASPVLYAMDVMFIRYVGRGNVAIGGELISLMPFKPDFLLLALGFVSAPICISLTGVLLPQLFGLIFFLIARLLFSFLPQPYVSVADLATLVLSGALSYRFSKRYISRKWIHYLNAALIGAFVAFFTSIGVAKTLSQLITVIFASLTISLLGGFIFG